MKHQRQKALGMIVFVLGLVSALVLLSSCTGSNKAGEELLSPDSVLINGKIITVDPEDSIAEAVAVKDGKIIAVGSNTEVKKMIGSTTRVIDLNGLTATPGLIDAHCHFAMGGYGILYILDLSFPGVRKMTDVVEKVKAKVDNSEPGKWVFGRGWDEGKLEELRYIYASDIDPISPENPVYLMHTMGHYGTANSMALKLAKITKDTPDPPGGTIDRHPDRTPTGVLKETAMSLVLRLMPDRTSKNIREGIIELVKGFNSEGMTAAKEPGIGPGVWKEYQNVLAQDKLTVRMFILWDGGTTVKGAKRVIDRVTPFTKPYISTGDDRLISGGIKIYLDGSGGARTAWLYDEWNKDYKDIDKGNYGYPVLPADEFRKMVKMYHDAELHMSVHTIGDRAIDWLMDSYDLAMKENPIHGLRHGIIHCNIPTEHALDLMAEMQKQHDAGYPEAEAVHMWWIGDTYAGNFGPERCLKLKPYKTFLDRGMIWAATSDFWVVPYPSRYGIWAQIAREPLLGVYGSHPFGTEESIDVHNALRAYTIWSARQLFLEDKIGSIEVGKYADIAIWDKDMYTITTPEIKDLKCQMTLFEGKIVFQAEETPLEISSQTNH